MEKVKFINQELEENMKTEQLIKEKTISIVSGLDERMNEMMGNGANHDKNHMLLLYVVEFISALIIRMDRLESRIEYLEKDKV